MRGLHQILILFFLLVSVVLACGATNHNVIGNRALKWFNVSEYVDILSRHKNVFQMGCAFPDWAYPQAGLHDISEATHWPPFIKAMANYIRTNYPKPYRNEGEQLVALLFGIMVHSVSDILWHDLATVNITQQGWIQTMAQLEYSGVYDDAHSESDTGAEFVLANVGDLSFLLDDWYFPIYDMVTLYHQQNFTLVGYQNIIQGNVALFAETEAMRNGAGTIEFLWSQNSTMLQENLFDFWLGGIDDMAVWALNCFSDIIDWLENGVQPDTPIKCYVEPQPGQEPVFQSRWNGRKAFRNSKLWKEHGQKFLDNVEVVREKNHIILKNKKDPATLIQQPAKPKQSKAVTCSSTNGNPLFKNSMTIQSNAEHAYFGSSISYGDINKDGFQDIVIGAPGYSVPGNPFIGAAVIYYGNGKTPTGHLNQTIDFEKSSSMYRVIKGNSSSLRFGSSVLILDYNCDGFDDLVVSAPSTNWETLEYRGLIFVFLQNPKSNTLPSEPTFQISVPRGKAIGNVSEGVWANLGTLLQAFDINNDGFKDLIVGSKFAPNLNTATDLQRGLVSIFLSSPSRIRSATVMDADWTLVGEHAFDWFGEHVNFFVQNGTRLLLIGAPNTQSGKNYEQGCLYAYNLTHKGHANKLWQVCGNDKFSKVGSHSSFGVINGRSMIAIAAPTRDIVMPPQDFWQGGSLLVVPVDQIQPGSQTFFSLASRGVLLNGISAFGRVGWSSLWNDGSLWVAQPFVRTHKGTVWQYQATSFSKPGSVIQVSESTATNCVQYDHDGPARYGNSLEASDLDNNGKVEFLITAPQDSRIKTQSGSVTILFN